MSQSVKGWRTAGRRVPEPPHTEATVPKTYKPLLEIGRGGMGVVTLALARGPEGFTKLVVLKRLHEHLLADGASVKAFLEEARVSARLAHPNIVQVYEATLDGAAPTIVMEYVEGQPLSALVAGSPPLPLELQLAVLIQALRGLEAAHELVDYDGRPLALVHRDMSPHNIIVGYDGAVKVLDFGIAKVIGSEELTRTGVLKGKLRYMSPEQVQGEALDRRTDLFSVGVMLREALTGRRMWGDANDAQVVHGLLSGVLPAPSCSGVEPRLLEICERALRIAPDQRYATAGDLRRELQDCLAERTARFDEQLSEFLSRHYAEQRVQIRRAIAERVRRTTSSPPAGNRTSPRIRGWHGLSGRSAGRWRLTAGAVLLGALATMPLLYSRSRASPTSRSVTAGESSPSECAAGMKPCDGRCVSIERPEYGCGSDSCAPCDIANATPRCNRAGQCALAVCYRGYDDCDGVPENGCEVFLRTDPGHCGDCSRACPELPHAEVGCGDSCKIWRCAPGHEDCNGVTDDGCETDTLGDAHNCGACGVTCRSGKRCRGGRCSQ